MFIPHLAKLREEGLKPGVPACVPQNGGVLAFRGGVHVDVLALDAEILIGQ